MYVSVCACVCEDLICYAVPFHFNLRTPFSISCRACLLVTIYLSLCLKCLNFFFMFVDNFMEYEILI